MEHIPVKSSYLESVAYDPVSQTLQVRFLNGGLYNYQGVEPAHYNAFISAPSLGRHLAAHIKPYFKAERVDTLER